MEEQNQLVNIVCLDEIALSHDCHVYNVYRKAAESGEIPVDVEQDAIEHSMIMCKLGYTADYVAAHFGVEVGQVVGWINSPGKLPSPLPSNPYAISRPVGE